MPCTEVEISGWRLGHKLVVAGSKVLEVAEDSIVVHEESPSPYYLCHIFQCNGLEISRVHHFSTFKCKKSRMLNGLGHSCTMDSYQFHLWWLSPVHLLVLHVLWFSSILVFHKVYKVSWIVKMGALNIGKIIVRQCPTLLQHIFLQYNIDASTLCIWFMYAVLGHLFTIKEFSMFHPLGIYSIHKNHPFFLY